MLQECVYPQSLALVPVVTTSPMPAQARRMTSNAVPRLHVAGAETVAGLANAPASWCLTSVPALIILNAASPLIAARVAVVSQL